MIILGSKRELVRIFIDPYLYFNRLCEPTNYLVIIRFLAKLKGIKMKIFVCGLSNSLMKDGYVYGIKDYFSNSQVINKSLGGSNCAMGIWHSKWFEEDCSKADLIIFEFFIMDYQNENSLILRDLPAVLNNPGIRDRSAVILWPDMYNTVNPNELAVQAYENACRLFGVPLVNCITLFRE